MNGNETNELTTSETEVQRVVDAAITSRRAIRAFLPTPVSRHDMEQILEVARRPFGQQHPAVEGVYLDWCDQGPSE